MKTCKLQRALKAMCRQIGIELPEGAGWHALRRPVITRVYEKTTAKELPIRKYFRWSTKGRGLGMLPVYVKTPVEHTDKQILSEHPLLSIWEDIVPYLVKLHPEYEVCYHNM